VTIAINETAMSDGVSRSIRIITHSIALIEPQNLQI